MVTEPIVFQFATWVVAIPFVIAGIAATVAIFCFVKGLKAPAVMASFVVLLAGGIFGPSMLRDRVVVSSDEVQQTTGFVFAPTVKGFRFEDVSYVHITRKVTDAKGRINMVWEIHEKSGATRDIDPGDLWETNSSEIAALLKRRGVEFR